MIENNIAKRSGSHRKNGHGKLIEIVKTANLVRLSWRDYRKASAAYLKNPPEPRRARAAPSGMGE